MTGRPLVAIFPTRRTMLHLSIPCLLIFLALKRNEDAPLPHLPSLLKNEVDARQRNDVKHDAFAMAHGMLLASTAPSSVELCLYIPLRPLWNAICLYLCNLCSLLFMFAALDLANGNAGYFSVLLCFSTLFGCRWQTTRNGVAMCCSSELRLRLWDVHLGLRL